MTFKAEVEDRAGRRVVRLAGRFEHDQAAELREICAGSPTPVRLDLSDLVSADETGLQTLGILQSQGAELTGASPYLALRLGTNHTKQIDPKAGVGAPGTNTHAITDTVQRKTEDR